jgi:hypothetical protein
MMAKMPARSLMLAATLAALSLNCADAAQFVLVNASGVTHIQPGCYDVKVITPFWNECIIAGATLRGTTAWTITPMMLGSAVFGDCSYTEHYVSAGRREWTWW